MTTAEPVTRTHAVLLGAAAWVALVLLPCWALRACWNAPPRVVMPALHVAPHRPDWAPPWMPARDDALEGSRKMTECAMVWDQDAGAAVQQCRSWLRSEE